MTFGKVQQKYSARRLLPDHSSLYVKLAGVAAHQLIVLKGINRCKGYPYRRAVQRMEQEWQDNSPTFFRTWPLGTPERR